MIWKMCIEIRKNNFIHKYVFYLFVIQMKKKWIIVLCTVLLILIICFLIFNKREEVVNEWYLMDWQWMVNEVSSYRVDTQDRWDAVWEDIFVYDENDNLVLSLDDKDQPQYLFVLYEGYLVLDSGTSASQREILVYDIPSGEMIYKTDYYPGENGLVLNDNEITFYRKIDDSLLSDYILPHCENKYDNGYIGNYGYTIWEDQANDLGDIQCAYFE